MPAIEMALIQKSKIQKIEIDGFLNLIRILSRQEDAGYVRLDDVDVVRGMRIGCGNCESLD
jgi:hypothetical protein